MLALAIGKLYIITHLISPRTLHGHAFVKAKFSYK